MRHAVAAVAALLLAATPASAAPPEVRGGCALTKVTPALADDTDVTWLGTLDVVAVVLPPVPVTVTCAVLVGGVARPGPLPSAAAFGGTGVVAGAAPVSFVASDADAVTLCEMVALADGTPVREGCVPVSTEPLPETWCESPPGSAPPPGWCFVR